MQEYLSLMGKGFNHLYPRKPSYLDFLYQPFMDQGHEEEACYRAKELIAEDLLDFEEVELYKTGEVDYASLYEVAKAQARSDLCNEVYDGGCDE